MKHDTATETTPTEARTRKLKVYYGYTGKEYKQIPVIRLGGDYLSKIGFAIGDTLCITLEKDKISITKRLPSEADLDSAEAQLRKE